MKLSLAAIESLKRRIGFSGDCETEILRISKYQVIVKLVRDLGLIAKFKINVKNGSCIRII